MSYARFGWGGSDVYVYGDGDGYLVCCACKLNGPVVEDPDAMFGVSFPDNWRTIRRGPTYVVGEPMRRLPSGVYGEMVAHLSEHVDAGHVVPDRTFSRLSREQAEAIAYERSQ